MNNNMISLKLLLTNDNIPYTPSYFGALFVSSNSAELSSMLYLYSLTKFFRIGVRSWMAVSSRSIQAH